MKRSLSALVTVLTLSVNAKDYKLVVEVARHGVRSPQAHQVFDLTVDPKKNFDKKKEKELVEAGGKQHWVMGQFVRQRYGHFIGDKFDSSKMFVMSTGKSRTVESAKHQIQGIFDKPFVFPARSSPIPVLELANENQSLIVQDNIPDHVGNSEDEDESITVVADSENKLSRLDKTNCPRIANMNALTKKHPNTKAMMKEMNKTWEKDLFPRLRQLAEMPNATVKELKWLCTYLYWAEQAGLKLKIDLDEEDIRNINSVVDSSYYRRHLADPELASFSNYEFFKQFNEFTKVVRDGASWKDLPYFSKYFKKSDQKVQDAVHKFPKFVFYSAHAETLASLFVGYNHPRVSKPSPGSAIFLEFFSKTKEDAQVYVRAYYKKADFSDEEVLAIPGAVFVQDDGSVTIEQFDDFVFHTLEEYDDKRIGGVKGDLQTSCFKEIKDPERELADPTTFHKQLFHYWGIDMEQPVPIAALDDL